MCVVFDTSCSERKRCWVFSILPQLHIGDSEIFFRKDRDLKSCNPCVNVCEEIGLSKVIISGYRGFVLFQSMFKGI